jgi:hypothetical protein
MTEPKKISWKTMKKSPYLTSAAFGGKDRIVLTIAKATQGMTEGLAENTPHNIIHFVEQGYKPMLVNSTNAKTISFLAGSEYIEDWAGTVIELYTIDGVKAFGAIHDGVLRVSRKKVVLKKPEMYTEHKQYNTVIAKLESGDTTWDIVEKYYEVKPETKAQMETDISKLREEVDE